jgi:hypothetical protein
MLYVVVSGVYVLKIWWFSLFTFLIWIEDKKTPSSVKWLAVSRFLFMISISPSRQILR